MAVEADDDAALDRIVSKSAGGDIGCVNAASFAPTSRSSPSAVESAVMPPPALRWSTSLVRRGPRGADRDVERGVAAGRTIPTAPQ